LWCYWRGKDTSYVYGKELMTTFPGTVMVSTLTYFILGTHSYGVLADHPTGLK
jgi:hypothetical protein